MARFLLYVAALCLGVTLAHAQDENLQASGSDHAPDRTVLFLEPRRIGEPDVILKGEYIVCRTIEDTDFVHRGVVDSIGEDFLSIGSRQIYFSSLMSITRKRDRSYKKRMDYKFAPYAAWTYGAVDQRHRTSEGSINEIAVAVAVAVALGKQTVKQMIWASKTKPTRTFYTKDFRIRSLRYHYDED